LEVSGCTWLHLKSHTLPYSDGKCGRYSAFCGTRPDPARLVADRCPQDVYTRSQISLAKIEAVYYSKGKIFILNGNVLSREARNTFIKTKGEEHV